jgi:hypothetical protein
MSDQGIDPYVSALSIYFEDQEVLKVVGKVGDNEYRVSVRTVWSAYGTQGFALNVFVPTATPLRFSWDEGRFGYVVQNPGGVERFCHPRLRSTAADELAKLPRRDALNQITDWGWWWEDYYDRVNAAMREAIIGLSDSRQRMDRELIRSRLQRSLSQLLSGTETQDEDEEEFKGLPLTDAARVLRQKHEVEMGFPQTIFNAFINEKVRLAFLEQVDSWCDVLHTGKNKVGRYVMRVHPEAPQSHSTGRPLPEMACALNAFAAHANPVRIHRENRGIVDCLDLVHPVEPTIRMKGYKLPTPYAAKVTVLNMAFLNIPNRNVYTADEQVVKEGYRRYTEGQEVPVVQGESLCLDKILLCNSGAEKLLAHQTKSDLLDVEEWELRKEVLSRQPGFRWEEVVNFLDTLAASGLPVYEKQYRYWYNTQLTMRYDKLKLLYGGVKAITAPYVQHFACIGQEFLPVDAFVAEDTVLAKGAKDLIWAPLAHWAGIEEIDPTWTDEEITQRIGDGLEARHLPRCGRFPVFVKKPRAKRERPLQMGSNALFNRIGEEERKQLLELFELEGETHQDEYEKVGTCIVGPVPVVRAQETEYRQSNTRTGIKVDMHLRNIVGLPFSYREEDERRLEELGRFNYLCSSVRS